MPEIATTASEMRPQRATTVVAPNDLASRGRAADTAVVAVEGRAGIVPGHAEIGLGKGWSPARPPNRAY